MSKRASLKSPLKEREFYCVRCGKRVAVHPDDIRVKKDKRGRPRMQGICNCECKVFKYIKIDNYTKLKNKYG